MIKRGPTPNPTARRTVYAVRLDSDTRRRLQQMARQQRTKPATLAAQLIKSAIDAQKE